MKSRNDFAGVRKRAILRSVVAMAVAMSLLVSGCVSMKNVPLPEGGQPLQAEAVKAGDKVQVETRSGEILEFVVSVVEPEALVGKWEGTDTEVRVRFQDIRTLRVQHVDAVRTYLGCLEAVGVVLLVAAWVAIELVCRSGFSFR